MTAAAPPQLESNDRWVPTGDARRLAAFGASACEWLKRLPSVHDHDDGEPRDGCDGGEPIDDFRTAPTGLAGALHVAGAGLLAAGSIGVVEALYSCSGCPSTGDTPPSMCKTRRERF